MFKGPVEIGLSWLSGQRLAMQRLLERPVRQSSFTQDQSGVNAVVSMIEAELSRIGLKGTRIPSARFVFESAANPVRVARPPVGGR
jgi:hypothetical protein